MQQPSIARGPLALLVAILLIWTGRVAGQVCSGNGAGLLYPFNSDGTWTAVPRGDDNSIGPISIGFPFQMYGETFTSCYINNNGNITFGSGYGAYTPSGFPSSSVPRMLAPFWADVDTRPSASGIAWYKRVDARTFVVSWVNVGYYNNRTDRRNTFQVIISDGESSLLPAGSNVGFSYDQMCWTTGDASEGSGGFGGSAATVGANAGDGATYFQFGRFSQPGSAYGGPFSTSSGVGYLSNREVFFDTGTIKMEVIDPNPGMLVGGGSDEAYGAPRSPDSLIDWSEASMIRSTNTVQGAACDGVTRLLLRVRVPGPGTVDFALADDLGGNASVGLLGAPGSPPVAVTLSGVATRQVESAHYAFACYAVPSDFWRFAADSSLSLRLVRASARYRPSNGGNGDTAITKDLRLVRPPVLLLHGWNSSASAWTWTLRDDPRFPSVVAQNYSGSNQARFSQNYAQPRLGSIEAAGNLRAKGYACSRVDIVGHSMGGLLARIHAGNRMGNYYRARNLGQGDFHKLITLYSPHYGSGCACILDQLNRTTIGRLMVQRTGLSPELGAVPDLRPDSWEIQNLPGVGVPTHVIAGVGGSEALAVIDQGSSLAGRLSPWVRAVAIGVSLFRVGMAEATGSADHDIVVGRTSAWTGVLGAAASSIGWNATLTTIQSTGIHIGVGSEQFVGDQVIRPLLDAPVASASFSPGLPANSTVPVPWVCFQRDTPPYVAATNGGIEITAPANGASVNAGGSLQVTVARTGAFSPTSVYVLGPLGTAQGGATPFTATIPVPPDAVGQLRVDAIAIDDGFNVAFAPDFTINVVSTAVLQSIEAMNPLVQVYLPSGTSQASIIGRYSGGIVRDITSASTGTSYTSASPAIAAVSVDGKISAVSLGTTQVIVQNASRQATIEVRVAPPLCPPDFNGDGVVSVPDLAFFLGRFGEAVAPGSPSQRADFDADGAVGTSDLVFFLGRFGIVCG